jgi:anti-anti-sigma regulatory factor
MGAVPDPSTSTPRVHRTTESGGTVLRVDGLLDIHAGAELVAAVAEAVEAGSTTLDIDLSSIDGYDEHGASALRACGDAAQSLGGSFHYRTCSGGPGQDVLLSAYADEG